MKTLITLIAAFAACALFVSTVSAQQTNPEPAFADVSFAYAPGGPSQTWRVYFGDYWWKAANTGWNGRVTQNGNAKIDNVDTSNTALFSRP